MENFLQNCRDNLSNLVAFDTVHIVVGNESADLDSAIAALVLAYHLKNTKYSSDTQAIVLPLLNLKREELRLVTELAFWFQDAVKLDTRLLICKDEVNFDAIKGVKNVLISLVDHNEDTEFESLGQLFQVVDHHKPSETKKHILESLHDSEINERVGSCCTLVAKRIFPSTSSHTENGTSQPDVQIALMLYGPILLDTVCFSESLRKFSEEDVVAINELERIMGSTPVTRQEVYQQLMKAKNSVATFTFEELLKKDLKHAEPVGHADRCIALASLPGLLSRDLVAREGAAESLENFRRSHPYVAVVILGIDNSDQNSVRRDITVYAPQEHTLQKICECLEKPSANLSLQLMEKRYNMKTYEQGNVKASRKVILPLVDELLTNDETLVLELAQETDNAQAKRKILIPRQISTADVDPEFVENYQAETVDFPESPKQHLPPQDVIAIHGSPRATRRAGKQVVTKQQQQQCQPQSSPAAVASSPTQVAAPLPPSKFGGKNQQISVPQSSSVQPASLCYYESYFDDSYVGDFTGDVDASAIEENELEPTLNNWCDNSSLNNSILEFGFDSFGPESLMFNVEGQPHEVITPTLPEDADNQFLSLSVTEPQLKEKVKTCFDQAKIMNSYELTAESPELQDEQNGNQENGNETGVLPENVTNGNSASPDISVTPDMVQTPTSEPLSSTDSPTPTSVDDATAKASSEVPETVARILSAELGIVPENEVVDGSGDRSGASSANFSRNSTLTRSQRRKISPKINFEQILNTSDDLTTPPVVIASSPSHGSEATLNPLSLYCEPVAATELENGSGQRKVSTPTFASTYREDSLPRQGSLPRRKILVNKEILDNDDLHDTRTPASMNGSPIPDRIPELTFMEELDDTRQWKRSCPIGNKGDVKTIDMKVIEPYKKVLSHAGYYHHYNSVQLARNSVPPGPGPAIITFSACYLPDRSRKDYSYVMDHLFMYVLTTLHELVADDYMLVYFHNPSGGGVTSNNMPTFGWLKRCYEMIDRRLRKNLRGLYLVHPTFWLKTLVIMTKPFISSKFSRKLRFVATLAELNELVPMESLVIPPSVKQVEFDRQMRLMKKSSNK